MMFTVAYKKTLQRHILTLSLSTAATPEAAMSMTKPQDSEQKSDAVSTPKTAKRALFQTEPTESEKSKGEFQKLAYHKQPLYSKAYITID